MREGGRGGGGRGIDLKLELAAIVPLRNVGPRLMVMLANLKIEK